MKTLTLTQPWATLVAIGAKRIETRSWRTSYRGPLAIHAAKGFPKEARVLCRNNPFHRELYNAGFASVSYSGDLPLGCVIATCRLVDCAPTELVSRTPGRLSEQESAFGDYSYGRWAWILSDVAPLPQPIPAKGALSLWEWPEPTFLWHGSGSAART